MVKDDLDVLSDLRIFILNYLAYLLKALNSFLRIRPVPIPHAPLIKNAVKRRGACHPPPMGLPLSGNTIIRANREGRMAPNRKVTAQYPTRRGKLPSSCAKRIPQIPPQKASEKTAGIPNGEVAVIEKGANGANPTIQRTPRVSWWKTRVERKPAIKPYIAFFKNPILVLL
jgi:hypothetical protein